MNSSPFTGHQFGLAAPSVPGPANFGFNGILDTGTMGATIYEVCPFYMFGAAENRCLF